MYKICFYVPESHVEPVKEALFSTGAGRIGHYDKCSWQCLGEGRFRPLAGSQPAIGQHKVVESVAEYKVELVCSDAHIHDAIAALKASHPYEEPAFDVVEISSNF